MQTRIEKITWKTKWSQEPGLKCQSTLEFFEFQLALKVLIQVRHLDSAPAFFPVSSFDNFLLFFYGSLEFFFFFSLNFEFILFEHLH